MRYSPNPARRPYRGENDITAGDPIGHEIVGVVEEMGDEVSSFGPGDFVIAPFVHCGNTCPHCRAGITSACENQGFTVGGQAEYAKVHQAEGRRGAAGTSDAHQEHRPGRGIAPVRSYLSALLDLVISGTIDPGVVFDLTLPLDEVAEGYKAMDQRRAIKVLLQP